MMTDEKLFDGCPYTGKKCFNAWDCAICEVEAEVRLWMEELKEEEDDEREDRISVSEE